MLRQHTYALTRHATYICLKKNECIVAAWQFLIGASKDNILKLPLLRLAESLTDERFQSLPACVRYFIGCNIERDYKPRNKPSPSSTWSQYYRQFIADNIHLIRHWKVSHDSYENVENVNATWFVDPPYIGEPGKRYRESNANINYAKLARWVRERRGLRIKTLLRTGYPFARYDNHITRCALEVHQ